ncbi:MAG: hypothetical protein IT521_06470 [Burkholderiales bacterium]|nr:hypothetical protein [Burkholderiales bacterium]
MKANLTLKHLRTVAALAALLGSVNGLAADPVRESFDRMLSHQPGPVGQATGADRDADPLTHAMVLAQRDRVRRPPLADPVAESFARMLAHAPSAAAPLAPSSPGPDPLIAAMVVPLRQSLSDSARATQFAIARGDR